MVEFIEKNSQSLAKPPPIRSENPPPRGPQVTTEEEHNNPNNPAERPARRRRRRRRGKRDEAQQTTPPVDPGAETAPEPVPARSEPASGSKEPESNGEKRPDQSGRNRRRRSGRNRADRNAQSDDGSPIQQARAPGSLAHAGWDPSSFEVEPLEGKTRFQDLSFPSEIMHAVADLEFKYCTPIQAEILPSALRGEDATGKAQTGTGKTAAFLITIFSHLLRHPAPENLRNGTPRALVLAPTRELTLQIEKDAKQLAKYTDLHIVAVFGGMDYVKQRRLLAEQRVDLVVATPGRLLDYKRQQELHLNHVEVMVIDEADRMLDMGFIPDVRQIINTTPPKSRRQTMLFSATLTQDVVRLARQWTSDAVSVEIEPQQVAVDSVNQVVYIVTTREKFPLLLNVLRRESSERVMVFANRRDQCRKLTELLERQGISCALLSGDVPQAKRIKTLERFREGAFRVLVATDVAGRGIHVEDVSHVINFTLPQDPEDYVHRIGRTGRAGATGTSISFACEADAFQIPAIEEYIGNELACIHPEDEWLVAPPLPPGFEPTSAAGTSDTSRSSDRRPGRRRPQGSRAPGRR